MGELSGLQTDLRELPSAERLRYLFDYDAETGIFRRRVDVNNRLAGSIAGSVYSNRYWGIHVDGRRYCAHRLAWKYVHGADPKIYIDHINGDGLDNRIRNLREADTCENIANSKKRVRQAYPKGVSLIKQKYGVAYQTQICHRGVRKFIGNFKTPEEAHAAYMAKQEETNGAFANPG